MGLYFWIQSFVTAIILYIGTNWFITTVIFPLVRDVNPLVLKEQAQISSVRKEGETAHYRNFLVPNGFPLTTGLNLAIGYKFRNGNFGDVWSAIMELAGKNFVKFNDTMEGISLNEINGYAKHISKEIFLSEIKQIGISVPVSTLQGFTIAIASMMATIKNDAVPHFLSSIPRHKIEDLDVLVVGSWTAFKQLNGSESWYKLIVVCDDPSKKPANSNTDARVLTWTEMVENAKSDSKYDYSSPQDKRDDMKAFVYVTSPWNETTMFSQMCMVSTLSHFIKNFPLNQELKSTDELEIVGTLSDAAQSTQIWDKLFGVLLHGGSVSFTKQYSLNDKYQPTLLHISSDEIRKVITQSVTEANNSTLGRIKLSWSTTFLSEGILTKLAQVSLSNSSKSINKLRCVYIVDILENIPEVSSVQSKISKKKVGKKSRLTSIHLNLIRAQFGSRAVHELHCPFVIMGPMAATNFFDYRVLPASVENIVTMYGSLSTTLEGKLIDTEENSEFEVSKRQGMLCLRGFSIGRPLEEERLQRALQLCEKVGGGEGWMPIVGVFGLWGHDGCFYLYK